jgi:type 1 glutamine amidotransferase
MRRILGTLVLAAMSLCLAVPAFAAENPPQRPGLAEDAKLDGRKKIVFLSGHPSHGYAQHEGFAGCMLLAKCLNENVPQVYCEVYKHEWPTDPKAFDNAAAIVIYCDGGGGHMAIKHLKELGELMDKRVGLGCIHYAVEVPKGEVGDDFLHWIGGYFETFHSINPDWKAEYKELPKHDVTRGVAPFSTNDEWYYHMRFRPEMKGVTEILKAVPPDRTRSGKDGAYSGNPEIRAELGKNTPETTVWVSTRDHEGRGFGCTGGHFHFNWGSDNFRKVILNSIVWIAHVEVPETGVNSKPLTIDDLLANLDTKKVDEKMKDELPKRLEEMNGATKPTVGVAK